MSIPEKTELLQPEGNGKYRIFKSWNGMYRAEWKNQQSGMWTCFYTHKSSRYDKRVMGYVVEGKTPLKAYNAICQKVENDARWEQN